VAQPQLCFVFLIEYPKYCKLLLDNNKAYYQLLKWVINFSYNKTEETLIPDIKNVSKETSISYNIIAKYIADIYNDVFELNYDKPNKFIIDKQTACRVSFNYLGSYASFVVGFNYIPRVGEQFNFPFIKPKMGAELFWVKEVTHEMLDGYQIITIYLTYDEPNNYLQLLKEKAYLHHELDWMEYRGELDSDVKEKLIRYNHNL
jgi:hypothetical protein